MYVNMLYDNYTIALLICYNTTENNQNKYNKNKEAKIAFFSSMLIHSIFIALDRGTVLPEPCILVLPFAFQTMEQVEFSFYEMQMELREMLPFSL